MIGAVPPERGVRMRHTLMGHSEAIIGVAVTPFDELGEPPAGG